MTDPRAPADQATRDQAVALAGLFQCVSLVRDVARRGLADARDFEVCIASVLRIDASSAQDVYGGTENLAPGLGTLVDQLGAGPRGRDPELTRYAVRLIDLERRLARRPDLLEAIREGVEAARDPGADEPAGDALVSALAELYVRDVSSLGPRVMVSGEPRHLREPRNAERVRALLLAGIRAAVLWRQVGGSRLRLLVRRARVAQAGRELLDERWE